MKPPGSAITALLEGTHADPFSLLGPHAGPEGTFARAALPGAEEASAFSLGGAALGKLARVDPRGLFEGKVKGQPRPLKYRCRGGGAEWWVHGRIYWPPVDPGWGHRWVHGHKTVAA